MGQDQFRNTVLRNNSIRIHIGTCSTRSKSDTWGETQYSHGLARAIENHGHEVHFFFRGENPDIGGSNDIVLRIVGPHLDEPIAGVPNILWVISPPNIAPCAMLNRYQRFFICSKALAEEFSALGVNASYLPQATDTKHFHPSRRAGHVETIPITFVGGYASRAPRRIVLAAIKAGFDVHVWGPGWKNAIPERHWRGPRLDYDQLAVVYANSRVVLNSHMPDMARLGMMSNRSFDAIASGAVVISDLVSGFCATDLPELMQAETRAELRTLLSQVLARPEEDESTRLERHEKVKAEFGFENSAKVIIRAADRLLLSGDIASSRLSANDDWNVKEPEEAHEEPMINAARQVLGIVHSVISQTPYTAAFALPDTQQQAIHPMMSDLRRAIELVDNPGQPDTEKRAQALSERARRLIEAVDDHSSPFAIERHNQADLRNIMQGVPIYPHGREDYSPDANKQHVKLWPRKQSVALPRPLGVFLHLFYDDLAETFAEHFRKINIPLRLYVSTDTDEKAARLKHFLPTADIRVMPNRGRDIYPKFFGFADAYQSHDLVLHLHGKKSSHADVLDDWLMHILDCLLPSEREINRILSFFQSIPSLGLVTPVPFKKVLHSAHWAANYEIAEELAFRMKLGVTLPGNDCLKFPVGSMFFGRVTALRPVLDLHLQPKHFPMENGQVDGTTAHAIERMIGVSCYASGHSLLSVAGHTSRIYRRYQKTFKTNRELRDALQRGDLELEGRENGRQMGQHRRKYTDEYKAAAVERLYEP